MHWRKMAVRSHSPPCASASAKVCRWRSNGSTNGGAKVTIMSLIYPKESLDAFPAHLTPGYRSTAKRSPSKPLIVVPHTLSELTGPVYGHDAVQEGDNDLTKQHKGEPLGERIIVHGRVLDEDKRPVPDTLVEIWQANACGRYVHIVDQHPAPLDPNFTGAGRTITDKNGYYKFVTVKPGAYPWGNHHNAWRPNH